MVAPGFHFFFVVQYSVYSKMFAGSVQLWEAVKAGQDLHAASTLEEEFNLPSSVSQQQKLACFTEMCRWPLESSSLEVACL